MKIAHHVGKYLNVGDPRWTVTRRITLFTMLWAGGSTAACMAGWVEMELAKAIVANNYALAMLIVGAYVAANTTTTVTDKLKGGDDANP